MTMTPHTLNILLRKKVLTANDRVRLLKEANQRVNQLADIFHALCDACQDAADEVDKQLEKLEKQDDPKLWKTLDERASRLSTASDDFDELGDQVDNLNIPELKEVR
jgi:ABC-type transporter Mla subunit MlaD